MGEMNTAGGDNRDGKDSGDVDHARSSRISEIRKEAGTEENRINVRKGEENPGREAGGQKQRDSEKT